MVASAAGDDALAQSVWEESVELFRSAEEHWLVAAPLNWLGDLCYRRGKYGDAQRLCEESARLWQEAGNHAGAAQSLASLGLVVLAQGDDQQAEQQFRASLLLAREAGSTLELSGGLTGLAAVLLARGDPQRAVRLLGAAEILDRSRGIPTASMIRVAHARAATLARRQLAEASFAEAWAEGGRRPLPDVIEDALEGIERGRA